MKYEAENNYSDFIFQAYKGEVRKTRTFSKSFNQLKDKKRMDVTPKQNAKSRPVIKRRLEKLRKYMSRSWGIKDF